MTEPGPTSRRPRKRPRRKESKGAFGIWVGILLLVLIAGYVAILDNARPRISGDALSFSSFVDMAENGRIKDATILDFDDYIIGHYQKSDKTTGDYNVPYLRGIGSDRQALLTMLLQDRVTVSVDQQGLKNVISLGGYIIPPLIVAVLFVYLIVSYRRGTGLFGVRSGAKKAHPEMQTTRFTDVAGQDAAITELREVVEYLRDPARFAAVGARIPKGILMYGPPGCGKTLLAKALAGEAGASFYSISGSDFVEVYVGVGAARVRDLFKEAGENSPALIFIDEIDAVGRTRGAGDAPQTGSGEQEQSLNAILTAMDGFSTSDGIIVIAATNRPDVLDPALLRPGRFDRSVALERPDERGRVAILAVHARSRPLAADVDLAVVANRAVGLTGADLANVVNEAALLTVRARQTQIGQAALLEALKRIIEAPERQRRLSMRDRGVGKRYSADERVTFADVAGVEDAVTELSEVAEYLANPERFSRIGARVPRGILLSGPPGCGKTLLARAVAGQANAAFFSVAATEFVEIYVGQGAARVRDLFAQARAVPPAIVFLDEIDAVGGRRETAGIRGNREIEQTLNQILVELDGFEAASGVIVMAATNRPDMLDDALVRPGRFDRKITIELPNREGRAAILAIHARGKPLAPDVDLDALARRTSGFSGADLATMLNEAALLAARRNLDIIPIGLINEAIDRSVLGVASTGLAMADDQRRSTAYHEAGHGLVGRALPGAPPVSRLSIIRRGHHLGATWQEHDETSLTHSRSALLDQMAALLAGRIAEELVFGEARSGAASDIERASTLARLMVTEYGMSERLGPIVYNARETRYSPEVAATIDSEVRLLVEEGSARARHVLEDCREALDRVAAALLEKEALDGSEFEELVSAIPMLKAVAATASDPAPLVVMRPPTQR